MTPERMYHFYQYPILRRCNEPQALPRRYFLSSASDPGCTTSGITGRRLGQTRSMRYVMHGGCCYIITDASSKAKYVYHVQGPGGRGESDMVDPVVMSFFLAVPVASMLWAVACFSVALAAFCIQGTDSHGRIVLIVVIGVGTTVSLLAALGFKPMFAGCSAISHDDRTNITLRI